ncbi:MAG TPA: ABC transporter ATP-binding protein [Chloroflexota bacterium]
MATPQVEAKPIAAPAAFLRIRDLQKRFGSVEAVAGLSLDVPEGQVFTLLGPSGCGKTTLLRLIAGLETPDAGEIFLGDRCLAAPSRGTFVPAEQREMGMVFQSYAIWPHMTVFENVAYPLKVRHLRRGEIRDRVMHILQLVGLEELYERPATRLSGGQQQRVSLARALVYSPRVLLLDEPLSNLDARLRDDMRRQIRRLQRQLKVTVIFVTHDQREAFSMSDQVAVLQLGHLEQVGAPEQVYSRPASTYVRDFLGRSLMLHGVLASFAGSCAQVSIDGMDGHLEVPLGDSQRMRDGRLQPGGAVKVTIRPEHLRVASPGDGRPGCVFAEVEEVLYLGEAHEYMIQLGGRTEVITLPGELRAKPGEQLLIELDPLAMAIWPDGEQPA